MSANIDVSILYEDLTIPLERVMYEDIIPETTYITKDGSRIKVLEDMDIVLVNNSPLNEGERVNTLSIDNGYAAYKLVFRLLDKQK